MATDSRQKVFKISIPVKIVLTGGVVYLLVFLLTKWAPTYFELAPTLKDIFVVLPIVSALLAFCLATYVFFDRPLARLSQAIQRVGEGDFLIRMPEGKQAEWSHLSARFNHMLMQITDLSARKIQSDYDLIVAQEELKYKGIIQKTNRSLENIVKDLALIYEIGQGINQTIEVAELYDVITNVLKKHLKLGNFSLMVWDEKQKILEIRAAFGFENLSAIKALTFQGGEGIAGQVLKTGQAIYVKDVYEDARFAKKDVNVRGSVLSVPLNYKGQTLGVVNFGRDFPEAFSAHDMKMLTLVANQIALAMANAKLYTQTRELSVTDELTNVFNRRHFAQVMQLEWKRAARFKRDLSLLMIDVDYFKRFNDTNGHLKGDEALRTIGKFLQENLREVDTVARFGGEEFVVLLPDTDKRGALAVAEKLRHLVQEGVSGVTISIGVSNHPEDVREIDDLIDHADIALYEAKDQGKNRVVLYHSRGKPEMKKPPEEEKEETTTKSRFVH